MAWIRVTAKVRVGVRVGVRVRIGVGFGKWAFLVSTRFGVRDMAGAIGRLGLRYGQVDTYTIRIPTRFRTEWGHIECQLARRRTSVTGSPSSSPSPSPSFSLSPSLSPDSNRSPALGLCSCDAFRPWHGGKIGPD